MRCSLGFTRGLSCERAAGCELPGAGVTGREVAASLAPPRRQRETQLFSLSKRRKLCLGACKRSQELQRRAERLQEAKNEGRGFPTRLCRLLAAEGSARRARRRWSRRGTLLAGGGPRAERPAGPQRGQRHGWEASVRGRPPPGAAAEAALSFFCARSELRVKARRAG